MHSAFEVSHRNYTKEGSFVNSCTLPWNKEADAITDANMVLEFYGEIEDMQAVGPCNIIVRGSNGRFIKWKR